jgi:ASC-1-like (ASCH) protein
MRKSWKLTDKILSGKKKIESRWYVSRYPPWNMIKENDTIYFKDSGEPVTIKAKAGKVLQFSNLNPDKVKDLLQKYYELDGIERQDIPKYLELFKDKNTAY